MSGRRPGKAMYRSSQRLSALGEGCPLGEGIHMDK
jgi:hypothetical protein